MKSLLFVTGTRADFGKISPLAEIAIQENFKVCFFITGMHMMSKYGSTKIEVKRLEGAEFFEFVNQRDGDSLELVLSKTIMGISDYLQEFKPDLVIVHGDRVEALAASLVCAMKNIRSCHIEGGEVSGTIDESIRHCNSKLCTTHMVSSEIARKRVILLGENPEHTYLVGSPELDKHRSPSGVTIDDVKSHYGIDFNEFGIAIFHPVVSEIDTIGEQASALFGAISESRRHMVLIAPNNDPGSEKIYAVIEKLDKKRFKIIPSMRFSHFSELLRNAMLVIGNSSVMVREAPSLGIPSMEIGSRQRNRTGSSIVTKCSAYNKSQIIDFMRQSWGKRFPESNEFGSGDSARRFIAVLKSQKFWEISVQKEYYESV